MEKFITTGRFMTQPLDEIDYVKDGVLYKNAYISNVLIGSEDDQALLVGCTPGTLAHTAGWGNMWELDVDGETWQPILTEEE